MATRVIPYAREQGYVWYAGAPKEMTQEDRLAHNAAQIKLWMSESRLIIDIGAGPFRTISANYDLERQLIRSANYPYHERRELGDDPVAFNEGVG